MKKGATTEGEEGSGKAAVNRLGSESSPYLRLHEHNPVHWQPWDQEALAQARAEQKAIFLSVGYSTCYWCHVMERESFADPETAALMNRLFVNIKVDREERPELDEIYMGATQILTGHGGWPNSVFLTPDLEPFYAGTYFPPVRRHGMPSFKELIQSLGRAWEERRSEVQMQAREVAQTLRRVLEDRGEPASQLPGQELIDRAHEAQRQGYDAEYGGFGRAPKFPTPSQLHVLEVQQGEHQDARDMLAATLDAMARGGIYDQLAGGFHRYATDRKWLVPHFEKMLYDNGLLLELYAREHGRSGDVQSARIAAETAAFLEAELAAPEGAFWSAIDAEVDGREGGHHVWTRSEIEEVLGAEDAAFLAPLYGFSEQPFFEGEAYVLHLPEAMSAQAQRRQLSEDALWAQIAPLRSKLLAARRQRPMPLVDHKILTDWNGTAISGLAEASLALNEEWMLDRARQAASFILEQMCSPQGLLMHAWQGTGPRFEATLGDYAFLIRGLLSLHRVSGEDRWLQEAKRLTKQQIERLQAEGGGFHTAGQRADLIFRSREVFDGALPSANGIAALNLLELTRLDGSERWLEPARRALLAFGPWMERSPEGAMTLVVANHQLAQHGESVSAARPTQALHQQALDLLQGELQWTGEEEGDGYRPFRLQMQLAEGWHLTMEESAESTSAGREAESEGYEANGESSGKETASGEGESFGALALRGEGVTLRRIVQPSGSLAADGQRVLAGRFELQGQIAPDTQSPADDSETSALLIDFQPCDHLRCLPRAVLRVPVAWS